MVTHVGFLFGLHTSRMLGASKSMDFFFPAEISNFSGSRFPLCSVGTGDEEDLEEDEEAEDSPRAQLQRELYKISKEKRRPSVKMIETRLYDDTRVL